MLFSEYVLITANAINKQHFHTPLRELYYQLCCLQMSLVILLTDVVFLILLTTLISMYIYYSHLFPLYYVQLSFPYTTHTCFPYTTYTCHFHILLTHITVISLNLNTVSIFLYYLPAVVFIVLHTNVISIYYSYLSFSHPTHTTILCL